MDRRRVLAATFLAALVSACGAPASSSPDAAGASGVVPRAGRSVCLGSVPQVGNNLKGAAADVLEQLQGTYEEDPGFLGVVWDGHSGVIVVEAPQLLAWQARMRPLGVAVARSCVDSALLETVQAVLAGISEQQDGVMSAGYDVLDDAISVLGVDAEVLMTAMEEVRPGARAAALVAIAEGTLRINPEKLSRSRS